MMTIKDWLKVAVGVALFGVWLGLVLMKLAPAEPFITFVSGSVAVLGAHLLNTGGDDSQKPPRAACTGRIRGLAVA